MQHPHVLRLRGMTTWLQLRAKSQFTDAANFTLRCVGGGKDVSCGGGRLMLSARRCGVCWSGIVGQDGAVKHAKETGHTNFQEYK